MYHGWKIVLTAFCIALFGWGVGFYGVGVLLAALQALHGWPAALVSGAVTAYYLVGAALIFFVGDAMARWGPRAVTLAAVAAMGSGALAVAHLQAPWQLYLAFPLMAAGWAGMSGAAINTLLAPWFERRRGLAVSLALNGASLGGVIVAPLALLAIDRFGVRAAGPVDVGSLTLLNCNSGQGVVELGGIEALVNLTQLNLSGNSVADLSPLAGLTGLDTLDLSSNAIIELAPLAGLHSLTNLVLSSNSIASIAPLAGLNELTVLGLDSNPLVDHAALAGFPALTYLGLNRAGVNDLSLLAAMSDLQYLYAAFSGITDVSELGNHPALLEVGLGSNDVTVGVPALVALVNATLIDLGGNNNLPCADASALDDTLDGTGAPASGDGSAASVVRWGGCL